MSSFSSLIQRIAPAAIFIIFALTYVLLTAVVIMLVTGTLHVLNRNILQLRYINVFSTGIASAIFIISSLFFIKTFSKICATLLTAVRVFTSRKSERREHEQ